MRDLKRCNAKKPAYKQLQEAGVKVFVLSLIHISAHGVRMRGTGLPLPFHCYRQSGLAGGVLQMCIRDSNGRRTLAAGMKLNCITISLRIHSDLRKGHRMEETALWVDCSITVSYTHLPSAVAYYKVHLQ